LGVEHRFGVHLIVLLAERIDLGSAHQFDEVVELLAAEPTAFLIAAGLQLAQCRTSDL
jgi:hypothetical protein